MVRKALIAATVALLYGASAQAGGPLLPKVQSGLKKLPALTAPVVAPVRNLASAAARPVLSRPVFSAAALPGLATTEAKSYYYPPPDPGSGSDWLSYNVSTWYGKRLGPYSGNALVVASEFSTELTGKVLSAASIFGPCDASACAGAWVTNTTYFVADIIDFGLSRGAGIGTKVGPPPLPKRPEFLSFLTPTLVGISETVFGNYGPS